jgi:hypothetical protein
MPTYANGPTPALPIGGGGLTFVNGLPGEAVLCQQVAPATYAAVATLTAADLLTRLIVCSGTTYTVTTPTAALLDAAMPNAQQNDSIDFSIIATSSGTITLGLGTGVTAVGTMTVATATATMFRLRKTNAPGATSAWVVYRVG